jgi:hypothetical protein
VFRLGATDREQAERGHSHAVGVRDDGLCEGGRDHLDVLSVTSTAKMGGGKPFRAHVVIVVDRTGSMGSSCSAGGTKLTCAKNGVEAFLSGMDPAYDKVGLVVLPPGGEQRRLRAAEDH